MAASPVSPRRLAAEMRETPEHVLRYGGLAAVAAGVAIVWMVRG